MKTYELLNHGSNKLKLKKIISHKLDSEILLSKVLKINREQVLINLDKNIAIKNINKFNRLITRRLRSEPVAYIVNEKEFWSKKFLVNKNTLIPRPETELMVEKLVEINKDKSISILDIGTGSGCIIISLLSELKNASGIGIDICRKAVLVAKKNAKLIMKLTKCDAVKLESNNKNFNIIKELVNHNIPVMGHIGFTPQFKKKFQVEGDTKKKATKLLKEAEQIENWLSSSSSK